MKRSNTVTQGSFILPYLSTFQIVLPLAAYLAWGVASLKMILKTSVHNLNVIWISKRTIWSFAPVISTVEWLHCFSECALFRPSVRISTWTVLLPVILRKILGCFYLLQKRVHCMNGFGPTPLQKLRKFFWGGRTYCK